MTQKECEHELDEALRVRENTARDRMIALIETTNIHNVMCKKIRNGGENTYLMLDGSTHHLADEAIALVRSQIANKGMTHRYRAKYDLGMICVSLVKKDEKPPKRSRFSVMEEQLEEHEDILNALTHHPLIGSEMKLARERFEEWKKKESTAAGR